MPQELLDYSNLPINALLLITVVILWRKLQQREEAIQLLIERVLMSETSIKQMTAVLQELTAVIRSKL